MEKISRQDLGHDLNSYSRLTAQWTPEAGDTFLLFSYRKQLQQHINQLSESQLDAMAKVDALVINLAEKHYEDETDDVLTLRVVADFIKQIS